VKVEVEVVVVVGDMKLFIWFILLLLEEGLMEVSIEVDIFMRLVLFNISDVNDEVDVEIVVVGIISFVSSAIGIMVGIDDIDDIF
jgi:hypothetical protein